MIKKILTFSLILLSVNVFSQKVEIRPALGIIWNSFNTETPMRENMNYMAGIGINNYGHTFYAETGAYWNSLNIKSVKNEDSIWKNQLRIPVKLGINFVNKDKKSFNFRMFAGPVAGVTIEDSEFNWSINCGFGVDIYPCFLNVGYDLALTDYKDINVNYFYVKTGFIIMTKSRRYR